jgi:hypothetical protein
MLFCRKYPRAANDSSHKAPSSRDKQALTSSRFLSSCPERRMSSALAFGLTQTQSMPDGARCVPFVSMAISKPKLCKASTSASSSWRSGSPPVQTTNGRTCADGVGGHRAETARANAWADGNRPPPGPSIPTKSVSQNRQRAVARSTSRPDHRLQPAKRQKTAGRPVLAPSPCKV